VSDFDQLALKRDLQDIVAEMQQIQGRIAADQQPVSMHEIDALKRLGRRYADLLEQMASLPGSSGQGAD